MNDKAKPTSNVSAERHTHRGSAVINLLGKVEPREEPEGAESFTLRTVVGGYLFLTLPRERGWFMRPNFLYHIISSVIAKTDIV